MNIEYEDLSDLLIKEFPELSKKYRKELEWWEDEVPGPHNIYGNVLNPYILDLLKKDKEVKKLNQIFNFLEELAETENKKVQEVVAFTILERLSTEPILVKRAQKYMGSKTLQFLEELRDFWKDF